MVSAAKKSLDIHVVVDLPHPPPADQDFTAALKTPEFRHERDVVRALERLGHRVRLFGLFDEVQPFTEFLAAKPPDLVFPQCESFAGDRDLEPFVIGMLEMLRIPYAGASAEAHLLCKDKALSKTLLAAQGVRVPRFVVSRSDRPARNFRETVFPAICKPLGLEASEGIARASLVNGPLAAARRTSHLHRRFGRDVIVEEFIAGREIYVGLLGNERPQVLPPQELFFKHLPAGVPRIATYRAKWDEGYRKRWGIDSGKAQPLEITPLHHLAVASRTAFRTLKLSGYARLDFRLTPGGEVVFLEANPNPAIGRHDDFAAAAREMGLSYDELIQRIVRLGHQRSRRTPLRRVS